METYLIDCSEDAVTENGPTILFPDPEMGK